MLRYLVFLCSFCAYLVICVNPGPKYKPSKGEVWPKPQQEDKGNTYYTFSASQFNVKIVNKNCTILQHAVNRYLEVVATFNGIAKRHKARELANRRLNLHETDGLEQMQYYQGNLELLQIDLTQPCEDYPYFEMDESYNITVSATTNLRSASIWGILRGLESFVQLFYFSNDYNEVRINSTQISDFPRYAHRGILLDTGRHFISLENIFTMLDAMEMNKMNVFHWHIVDDQSFPYQSEKFPKLSERGAYDSSMVYSRSDVISVINYARDRGIRVLPEFDVPGHTRSWGEAYPNILTKCCDVNDEVYSLGPLDPTNNVTYKVLRDLFKEVQELFPEEYIHIGGDEVDLSCWISNPDIVDFMEQHNISSVNALFAYFMHHTIPLLSNTSKPIVWQEVYDEKVPLSEDTLVQVWKNDWTEEMLKVLSTDHRVIFSSSWYLDYLANGFDQFYTSDPRQMVYEVTKNQTLCENIVGGEACMWAEMVDDRNVLSRVWPRASAMAEVLWSAAPPPDGANYRILYGPRVSAHVHMRLEEHTCRMVRRGVPAEPPSGPGFCVV